MKSKLLPRILISVLGSLFILWGVISIAMGVVGESTTAVITDIRREGGERNDGIPGRYTYIISYSFDLPDGKEIHGFYRKIGDAVYLKADGTGRLPVKYFKAMPFINASATDAQLSIRQVILIGVGVLLIYLMNNKRTGKKHKPTTQ